MVKPPEESPEKQKEEYNRLHAKSVLILLDSSGAGASVGHQFKRAFMFSADFPTLNHEEQQKAVERIQELMAQGMGSGEAIALVAQEIRETHAGKGRVAFWDEE